ncbi:MAG: kinase/pyrophosphorylase [Atopobiaceae bacterium]|jgi:regulator of PEP synthase PpsR (kinase-PPPase family)|uniref:kinase/pyrophosphorylase n=1 Tax=Atopobiaceae TaxID=1643824 RepID=UPI003A90A272|nr:kinase/pyrophosphorylase [Atopobiaceae bacterium]
MAKLDIDDGLYDDEVPKIYVLSDSRGETANTVVLAAAAQFGKDSVEIERLSNVTDVQTVRDFFDKNYEPNRPTAVFHTFANGVLRREIRRELDRRGIPSIDLLGPAVTVLSTLTGEEPTHAIGATYGK